MLSFSKFLTESLQVDKLKHLEHAEDHIIHGGDEGMHHAAENLEDLHNRLTGGQAQNKVTTKYDGSPSVVFGVHPETNKFFVASKSAFNKNPKINYTEKDIDANHGHAPGLAAKLKSALAHLPKVMPKEGGVYQGDFLYDKPDLKDEDGKYKFTPNTITYGANKDSNQGRKIAASKMGFVVHTKYSGKDMGDMKAGFDVDHSKFQQDPDVNLVNPEINDTSKVKYTSLLQNQFRKHMNDATNAYRSMEMDTPSSLATHDHLIKPYINSTVRDGTTPNTKDYRKYLETLRDKEVAKLKSPKAQDKKAEQYNAFISHVNDKSGEFDKVFKVHHSMQKAKDTLVQAMGNPTDFEHSVGGKEVKPEGFVSIRNGMPTKLVDRAEFSKNNFANNRGRNETDDSEVNNQPTDSDIKNPHVFAFGRMNPPTVGHGALVDKVKDLASLNKAKHTIVLSHSNDPEKNPLTPEQKLKHAKRFFPGTNIEVADSTAPTFMDHAERLHKSGVDHLIMVAGSDRVEEYKKLLDRYNGTGPGKRFNFKKIDVVSAGQRDPDAEGVEGMSASKMRAHAMSRSFGDFKKGIPTHVHPEHARELYNDVRKGMHIDITPDMPGATLAKHAKREDEIGHRARAEQERRLAAKKTTKK